MPETDVIKSGAWRKIAIDEARTWIDTPYQHKGRVKGVGVDCGGLLYQVYNPIFGPLPAFPKDYPPDWAVHEHNERYLDFIKPFTVPTFAPVPGGLVVFKIGLNFAHGTLFTAQQTFIHAWGRRGEGSVKESKLDFFRIGGKIRSMKCYDIRKPNV